MKKAFQAALWIVLISSVFVWGAEKQPTTMKIEKAYVYQEAELLISEADLYCSYFLRGNMPKDIRIVGGEQMDIERVGYADGDRLYINRGLKDGLQEGNELLIISEGEMIHNPRTHGRIGHYFLKKSQAKITCIYDHQAVITLKNGCTPVVIGDFAIPFKSGNTLFARKIDFQACRLSEDFPRGRIVFMNDNREVASSGNYLSINLGEEFVKKGSFVIFYRFFKKDLPLLIIGSGIVIHVEEDNATVKVLDASTGIQLTDRLAVPPELAATTTLPQPVGEKEQGLAPGEERVPIVDTIEKEGGISVERMTADVYFPFDSSEVDSKYTADFEALKNFVAGKPGYSITLRGYADSIGNEEYNLKLSQARVEAVKKILVSQQGLSAESMESFFYGEKEALHDNSAEIERQKNRLVRIEVIGK